MPNAAGIAKHRQCDMYYNIDYIAKLALLYFLHFHGAIPLKIESLSKDFKFFPRLAHKNLYGGNLLEI